MTGTPPVVRVPDELLASVHRRLASSAGRVLIGVTGAPGAGKSTLAEAVVHVVDPDRQQAVWVPMDGFHLADVELARLGRLDRKGAIDTFDGWGYLALLRRIRDELDHIVYAPAFERTLEQPLAGAIAVPPSARLVITDGNYLLDDEAPWGQVRGLLDEVWFCELPDDERRNRLVDRHVQFGKSSDHAHDWVMTVDEVNARRIAEGRAHADRIVSTTASAHDEENQE